MMEGKTCLITGSTSGIGKEIAIGLARMKANVILVGRNKAKCEAAIEEICRSVSIVNNKNRVSYLLADLSSQADRKSTRLNSSHANISYAVFCLKKKNYSSTPLTLPSLSYLT